MPNAYLCQVIQHRRFVSCVTGTKLERFSSIIVRLCPIIMHAVARVYKKPSNKENNGINQA